MERSEIDICIRTLRPYSVVIDDYCEGEQRLGLEWANMLTRLGYNVIIWCVGDKFFRYNNGFPLLEPISPTFEFDVLWDIVEWPSGMEKNIKFKASVQAGIMIRDDMRKLINYDLILASMYNRNLVPDAIDFTFPIQKIKAPIKKNQIFCTLHTCQRSPEVLESLTRCALNTNMSVVISYCSRIFDHCVIDPLRLQPLELLLLGNVSICPRLPLSLFLEEIVSSSVYVNDLIDTRYIGTWYALANGVPTIVSRSHFDKELLSMNPLGLDGEEVFDKLDSIHSEPVVKYSELFAKQTDYNQQLQELDRIFDVYVAPHLR